MGRPLPDDLKVAVDILVAELKVRLKGDKVRSERLLWDDEAAALGLPPDAIAFKLELASGRRMLASVLPWGIAPEIRLLGPKKNLPPYPRNCPTPSPILTSI